MSWWAAVQEGLLLTGEQQINNNKLSLTLIWFEGSTNVTPFKACKFSKCENDNHMTPPMILLLSDWFLYFLN